MNGDNYYISSLGSRVKGNVHKQIMCDRCKEYHPASRAACPTCGYSLWTSTLDRITYYNNIQKEGHDPEAMIRLLEIIDGTEEGRKYKLSNDGLAIPKDGRQDRKEKENIEDVKERSKEFTPTRILNKIIA